MITVPQKDLIDFESATALEWLEANGIGGYASGTVSGAHTRRYHGLLVAAVRPPLDRAVLLSKLEETVLVDGVRYELSSNRYPDNIHPRGFALLTGFRLDPFPIWTYEVAGIRIEKKLFMVHGENTTVVTWSVVAQTRTRFDIALEVRPLFAFRDHHHLRRETDSFLAGFESSNGNIAFAPVTELPTLDVGHNASSVEATGYWYRNFEYDIERERGFDHSEDLFQPYVLKFDLGEPASIIASTVRRSANEADSLEQAELARRTALIEAAGAKDTLAKSLVLAADQFVVKRADGATVIAGYHWFSDWGRDTMIALNGLTIATGRCEVAKNILSEFALHISEGMLPNRFPDAADVPEYNTVDATLWFFEATRAYAEASGDYEFVRQDLYDRLVDIIDWHERGTRYGIHVDSDGLLYGGAPDVQLTWMDAKIGDWVVTPRTGKAVEIQALWYNALCILASFAERFGDQQNATRFRRMAREASESFNRDFWNESDGCLYDVVDGDVNDASIRPNQILAVSLPNSMLDYNKARRVVDKVRAELLTPVGLRSLSPGDPRYVRSYIGSPFDRDASYHQGTVWPWLIGAFIEACRKVYDDRGEGELLADEIRNAFQRHLDNALLGQVSEIFDADAPHSPRGCAAQAWSVAELLRVVL